MILRAVDPSATGGRAALWRARIMDWPGGHGWAVLMLRLPGLAGAIREVRTVQMKGQLLGQGCNGKQWLSKANNLKGKSSSCR